LAGFAALREQNGASCSRMRGVTLIELLIAVSLLSLLTVGMLMALRVGLSALDKGNSKLIANRRAASVERILESEIAGFMPASADCPGGAPNAPPVKAPFFVGQPQSMRFVSTYSLQEAARGYPRILEFLVIPGDRNEGVRLIVNERLYTGPRSTGASCLGLVPDPTSGGGMKVGFRPIEPGPGSFVLADRLAYCRFSYMERLRPPEYSRWHADWGLPAWPAAVRVEMAPLKPDPSRVPLVGLTVPIYVNRMPNAYYTDSDQQ
jgi:prepilin-type N-terminal cleavage/methylation domain-containing protein